QLNSAVRTSPTCGLPVGDGQKRTRTASGEISPSTGSNGGNGDHRIFLGRHVPRYRGYPAPPAGYCSLAGSTRLRSVPTPSTVTVTSSPASIGPTPAGVPVRITSPGSRVNASLT